MQSLTRARVLTADWLQPDLVKQKVAQVEESSMNWELEEFKEWSVPPHMHIISNADGWCAGWLLSLVGHSPMCRCRTSGGSLWRY